MDSSNSTSGNISLKVFLLIALASAPVSTWRVNFLSKERGVKPQPNSIMIGLSSDVPARICMDFSWYSLSGYHADTLITIKAEASSKADSRPN